MNRPMILYVTKFVPVMTGNNAVADLLKFLLLPVPGATIGRNHYPWYHLFAVLIVALDINRKFVSSWIALMYFWY